MANRKKAYKDMTNEEKIEEKRLKIRKLFKDTPREKLQFAEGLIYQFAVTTVTLERLVEELNKGDVVENFKQGSQEIRRENPALRSYNTTIKSFAALSKSLLELLPAKMQKQFGEELMNFATQPPRGARE